MLNALITFAYRAWQGIAARFQFPPLPKLGLLHHLLLSAALMFIALLARLLIAPIEAGWQYVTFFPAVTLAVIAGGFWAGIFATVLGVIIATWIFIPPYYSIALEDFKTVMWPNMVFLSDGLIISFSIEAMHRYRQKYENELREAKESEVRIKAVNKELDEFTYIASHDLKEPLRGIHNYASFLKEDYSELLDEKGLQYVSSIQRLAERMSSLTDQLLAYSKLGSTEIKKEAVNVDAVVDEVMEDLRSLCIGGIEFRRANKLGSALGDAVRIGEVFQNLIANAAKYNDKPVKWVEIGRDDSTKLIPVFYVRDNGIGIPVQQQGSVFRIFKRLHEQNKYGGGTGAGLTIVKKIIDRHGGHIWLESVPGEGTTFYFTLSGGE